MAEKLCTLRKKGGGKMKETVLWTNATPTSDFSAGYIDFSDNISNYKFISIKVRTNINISDAIDYYYDVSQIANITSASTYPKIYIGYYANSTFYYRDSFYQNDTRISISNCYYNKTNTTPATSNAAVIPVSISGWK